MLICLQELRTKYHQLSDVILLPRSLKKLFQSCAKEVTINISFSMAYCVGNVSQIYT